MSFMPTGPDALHVGPSGLLRISIVSSARLFVFQPFQSDTLYWLPSPYCKKKQTSRTMVTAQSRCWYRVFKREVAWGCESWWSGQEHGVEESGEAEVHDRRSRSRDSGRSGGADTARRRRRCAAQLHWHHECGRQQMVTSARTGMPSVRPLSKVSRYQNWRSCTTITRSCTKRSTVRNHVKNIKAKALWALKEAKKGMDVLQSGQCAEDSNINPK